MIAERITEKAVHAAADDLDLEGKKPGLEAIRRRLGDHGSYSTIQRFMRNWKPVSETVGDVAPPEGLILRAGSLAREMWSTAVADAKREADEMTAEAKDELSRCDENLRQMTQTADALVLERDEARRLLSERDEQLAASQAEAQKWRVQLAAAAAENAALQKVIARLTPATNRGKATRKPTSRGKPASGTTGSPA
jgi:hypothetical protein